MKILTVLGRWWEAESLCLHPALRWSQSCSSTDHALSSKVLGRVLSTQCRLSITLSSFLGILYFLVKWMIPIIIELCSYFFYHTQNLTPQTLLNCSVKITRGIHLFNPVFTFLILLDHSYMFY
jgi:hypothetical protein